MKRNKKSIEAILAPLRWMLVQFIVLYLFTGHALFKEVLPFVIMISIGTLVHMAFLAFVSPNLAEHRASFYSDTKP